MEKSSLPPIKGFLETSFVDWPGKVVAVVFLPGCNFRCPYCHNHGLVVSPEQFETWSLEGILEHLGQYRNWVDGVCITGGEPTGHKSLGALLECFKTEGWAVKLDTNGARPEVVGRLLADDLLDAVAVDIKAPFESLPYRRNSGWSGDPQLVADTVSRVQAARIPLYLRTTVHPHLLPRDQVLRMAAQLGQLVGANRADAETPSFVLQRCRMDEVLDSTLAEHPTLEQEVFAEWQRLAQEIYAGGSPADSVE